MRCLFLAALVAACGSPPSAVSPAMRTSKGALPVVEDTLAGPLILRDDKLFLADEDPPALRVFDAKTLGALWSADLEGTPAHVAIANDDRIFVAVRALGRVDTIDPVTHAVTTFAKPCSEPIGVAWSHSQLLVTCGWSHEVIAFSPAGQRLWAVSVPYEPRAILAKEDRAYVSHAAGGELDVVDLEAHEARTIHLGAGLNAEVEPDKPAFGPTAPGLTLVASNGFALTEHDGTIYASSFVGQAARDEHTLETSYYGSDFHDGMVYAIDPAFTGAWLYARLAFPAGGGCLAPRGVAVRFPEQTVTACPGEGALVVQSSRGALVRRYGVRSPSAIVVDHGRDVAITWSQQAHELTSIALAGGQQVIVPVAGDPHMDPKVARGKALFETTRGFTTRDGRGCVTCHPDGRSDGLTWGTPDGPRQTLVLAGRLAGSSPYGWTRQKPTLVEYAIDTMTRLGGKMKSDELEALVAYLETLRLPDEAHRDSLAGKKIFESSKTGCATCHSGKLLTDRKAHMIGEQVVGTPSLLHLAHTAPYFHDGKYATLAELLRDADGVMGHTKHLDGASLRALEDYLLTL